MTDMMPGIKDILMILPEIVVAVAACVLLMVEFLCRKGERTIIGVFAILTASVAAAISLYLMTTDYMGGVAFSGMFILDGYSTMFKLIFYLATILSIVISFYYTREEGIKGGEYYTLMLFSLCGMMVMASGRDLLTIYIGLELMSLPVYVLTGFLDRDKRSVEGAMKYVILGGFSSGILLYGISIIYGVTGSTELTAIAKAFGEAGGLTPVVGLAIVGLICGFGFKVAAVPFHAWTPDVYEGAPTPVTAFMSVGPKPAAFAIFLRVFTEGLLPVYEHWQVLVAVVAVATMFYGNIVAIVQTNIKRMLAYSSIGHAGYALLGLLPATNDGVASVIYYMFVYLFMNMGAFAVVVFMRRASQSGELIEDYRGLAKNHRALSLAMLVFMFSLAGIPPTAGFVGKFYIFMALVDKGMVELALIAVVASAVAAYFYIRVVLLMYMKEPVRTHLTAESFGVGLVIAVGIIGAIVLGVYPGYLIDLIQRVSALV